MDLIYMDLCVMKYAIDKGYFLAVNKLFRRDL